MKKTVMPSIIVVCMLTTILCFSGCISERPYLTPSEVFENEREGKYVDGDAVKVIYGYAEIEYTSISAITVIILYEDATKSSAPLCVYILKSDPYGTETLINQYFISAQFGITIVYDSFSTSYQTWKIVSHWDPSIYGVG